MPWSGNDDDKYAVFYNQQQSWCNTSLLLIGQGNYKKIVIVDYIFLSLCFEARVTSWEFLYCPHFHVRCYVRNNSTVRPFTNIIILWNCFRMNFLCARIKICITSHHAPATMNAVATTSILLWNRLPKHSIWVNLYLCQFLTKIPVAFGMLILPEFYFVDHFYAIENRVLTFFCLSKCYLLFQCGDID